MGSASTPREVLSNFSAVVAPMHVNPDPAGIVYTGEFANCSWCGVNVALIRTCSQHEFSSVHAL